MENTLRELVAKWRKMEANEDSAEYCEGLDAGRRSCASDLEEFLDATTEFLESHVVSENKMIELVIGKKAAR